jgi:signal transduction histidine kinase
MPGAPPSPDLLHAVLDALPDANVVADAAGRLAFLNRAAAALLDARPGDPADAAARDATLPDGATPLPPDRHPLLRALRGHPGPDVELTLRGRLVVASALPRSDPDGRPLGAIAVLRDVSDLRRALAALRAYGGELEDRVRERSRDLARAQEQLHRAQRLEAVGRLVDSIAHDFNNLLTAINGYSELLLLRLQPDDPSRDPIEQIYRAGERAAGLTRQLLAFSKNLPVGPKVVRLPDIVSGLLPLLTRLVGETVSITAVTDPGTPRVKADPGQIEQILMNLVVNARDAMPKGGTVTIETGAAALAADAAGRHLGAPAGPYALLAVTDTGTGMDEATLARLFEPFFTTKGPERGTGLGLATVYGIVKRHAGDIAVRTEPGAGSTFAIYLPQADAPGERHETTARVASPPGGFETILLVEDEPGVRALTRTILASYGYIVLEAADADEALQIAETHAGPLHLLLTDSVLPRRTGGALADDLRHRFPSLRVIIMSGYPQTAPSGAFLPKPFAPSTLLRRVRETLDFL